MSIADVDVLAAAGGRNALGQMVGLPVTDLRPAAWPPRRSLSGRFCRLEPLDAASHGPALFAAMAADERNWTYLSYGPFAAYQDYQDWLAAQQARPDPHFTRSWMAPPIWPSGWRLICALIRRWAASSLAI